MLPPNNMLNTLLPGVDMCVLRGKASFECLKGSTFIDFIEFSRKVKYSMSFVKTIRVENACFELVAEQFLKMNNDYIYIRNYTERTLQLFG